MTATESPPTHGNWQRWATWIATAGFLAIALFFLLTEHRAHFFGALPYLLLLACPLMHLFMHHAHGGRHEERAHGAPRGGGTP